MSEVVNLIKTCNNRETLQAPLRYQEENIYILLFLTSGIKCLTLHYRARTRKKMPNSILHPLSVITVDMVAA